MTPVLPLVAPIAIWVAISDLRTMKIPNRAVLALIAVFAVCGPLVLPLDDYLWRWSHFAVVLVAGFLLNAAGALGAGDAKFAAAMAPFIPTEDIALFLVIFSLTSIAAFVLHRAASRIAAIRQRTVGWESWSRREFPAGLALGPSLLIYLAAA